jgi:hypothetical protein
MAKCPFHKDRHASCAVNVLRGVFLRHAC